MTAELEVSRPTVRLLGGFESAGLQLHYLVAVVPWRLFGLFLLTLAIIIPSCQALFPRDAEHAPRPFEPEFVRE